MQLRSGKIYTPIIGSGKLHIANILELPGFLVDIAKKYWFVNHNKEIRRMFSKYQVYNEKQMYDDMIYLFVLITKKFIAYDLKILYISILFRLIHRPLYRIFRDLHVDFDKTIIAKLKEFKELKLILKDTSEELRLEKIRLVNKFQEYSSKTWPV